VVFEWDAKKASANARKHGVTFEQAATVFTDEELREITIGHTSQGRLMFISHCERAGRMRIIGARSASRAERKQYEEGIDPKTN
jgi:uncharacterized DUF497 family protein